MIFLYNRNNLIKSILLTVFFALSFLLYNHSKKPYFLLKWKHFILFLFIILAVFLIFQILDFSDQSKRVINIYIATYLLVISRNIKNNYICFTSIIIALIYFFYLGYKYKDEL